MLLCHPAFPRVRGPRDDSLCAHEQSIWRGHHLPDLKKKRKEKSKSKTQGAGEH